MQQRPWLRLAGVAALVGGLATAAAPGYGQQLPAPLARFLRQSIGLDSTQVAVVERGAVVVKVLETENKRDVAVFGIITADVPREVYVQRLRDFRSSLRRPTRVRFGIFSDPPSAADVQGLIVDIPDLSEVRDCRPGDCKIKLPATEMKRLREAIDWSGADPQAQLNAYARQRLLDYVSDYRARGDTAMVVYDDRGNVRASDAFAALLGQSPYVYEYVPSFQTYLATYPRGKLGEVAEVLYWSVDARPPGPARVRHGRRGRSRARRRAGGGAQQPVHALASPSRRQVPGQRRIRRGDRRRRGRHPGLGDRQRADALGAALSLEAR